jgi:WD40 repeat protein
LVRVSLKVVEATASRDAEEFPRPFGDYMLLEEVARGGMGVVYRARECGLDREVALKVTLSGPFTGPAALGRFRAEAQTVARLQHPNIVTLHEAGEAEGQPYYTMDFVRGHDLEQLVRNGPLPARQLARYVERIARAVHYAHEQRVLHRDLKPSNILIDEMDEPRVTDFGLAKSLAGETTMTLSGQTLGSPNYMAPEQVSRLHGAIDVRSDVYGLGALLYHLGTGRAPYVAGTVADTLHLVIHSEPAPPRVLNPTLPVDLETICLKCLQKDPARRYPSALAVAEELHRFLSECPILARPVGPVEKVWRWGRRNRALSTALVCSGLVALLAVGGVLTQWRRAEASERLTRLNLYAADMIAASYAIERGDLGLGQRLLELHRPRSGEPDLRGFEWHYLWPKCKGEHIATLEGHKWIVTCTAYSPDGRHLLSGSQDGTVRIWDLVEPGPGEVVPAHDGAVWTAQFTPEGDRFVTGGSDGKVHLWDFKSRRVLRTFPGRMVLLLPGKTRMVVVDSELVYWTPEGPITLWDYEANQMLLSLPSMGKGVAVSPDGATLAVAHREGKVSLWSIETGTLLNTLVADSHVWTPACSPTGTQLAAGSFRAAYVWNLAAVGPPIKLEHPLTVWATAFSPDGKLLATASSDRALRFWDTETFRLSRTARGHADEVWCVAFNGKGDSVATGGKDQSVRLWTNAPNSDTAAIRHTTFERPQFSPDGRYLVTQVRGDEGTQSFLWRMGASDQPVRIPRPTVLGFAWDGRRLVGLDAARREMTLRSIEALPTAEAIRLEMGSDDGPFLHTGLSPDGKHVFTLSASGRGYVFQVPTGRRQADFDWPIPKRTGSGNLTIRSAAISPGGQHFAVSTEQSTEVQLFEIRAGKELRLSGHRDFVSGLAFSPDGEVVATGSVDATIKLWRVSDGHLLTTLVGHMEEATDVAFSPDGRTLASVGFHSKVIFWHMPTYRELAAFDFPEAGFHLIFSPDGSKLAVTLGEDGNSGVQLLDAPISL